MAKSGIIAERYAIAIFELAEQGRQLDPVAADLRNLARMTAASPDLAHLIYSALGSRTDQMKAVAVLGRAAELSPLTRNFLGLLAGNRRLSVLPEIIPAFEARLAASRGEKTAEVISAQPLQMSQVEQLKDKLQGMFGGRVHLDLRVDADILGGLIVKVGSKLIDGSVRGKLDRLDVIMKGTV